MEKERPLEGVIKKLINDLGGKEGERFDFLETWEHTVGKKISKHTKPAFLKKERLVVNVSNSSWLYKLTTEKNKLIKDLNKNLKKRKKIKEIQFRIGEIKK